MNRLNEIERDKFCFIARRAMKILIAEKFLLRAGEEELVLNLKEIIAFLLEGKRDGHPAYRLNRLNEAIRRVVISGWNRYNSGAMLNFFRSAMRIDKDIHYYASSGYPIEDADRGRDWKFFLFGILEYAKEYSSATAEELYELKEALFASEEVIEVFQVEKYFFP